VRRIEGGVTAGGGGEKTFFVFVGGIKIGERGKIKMEETGNVRGGGGQKEGNSKSNERNSSIFPPPFRCLYIFFFTITSIPTLTFLFEQVSRSS
jgi:hypothetical protein